MSNVSSVDSRKVILVIIDGLRDDAARRALGFVEGMIEQGQGLRTKVKSVLPSLSRPCYESICTGMSPLQHGVVGNDIVRISEEQSIFDVVRAHDLVSAASAYYWFSELYCAAPFDPVRHRERNDGEGRIASGRFYYEDSYPDSHVFSEAESLRQTIQPDFLLIHPMGVDDAGHQFGSSSKQYNGQAMRIDHLLARLLPEWIRSGYDVLVTADHGMDEFGFHGGTDFGVRDVPLYVFSPLLKIAGLDEEHLFPQTSIAALCCRLLRLSPATSMAPLPKYVLTNWFS